MNYPCEEYLDNDFGSYLRVGGTDDLGYDAGGTIYYWAVEQAG